MSFPWPALLRKYGVADVASGEVDLSRAIMLTEAGREALDAGRAREALQLLGEKHALVLAQWGDTSVFAVTSAVDLADALTACGEQAYAEQILCWAIARYEAMGVDDERSMRAHMVAGNAAYLAADYATAQVRFTDIIARLERKGPAHDVQRAMAMDYLAQVLLRDDKFAAAERLLLGALAIFEREVPDSEPVAVCVAMLASVYVATNRYREAEDLHRRTIRLFEGNGDELSLAKSLDHLGIALAMRAQTENRGGLAEEAVEVGTRALGLFEKHLPEHHRSIFACRENLKRYRALAQSIGMMFSAPLEEEGTPLRADPAGHPDAIRMRVAASQRAVMERDYESALASAVDAHEMASRIFGAQSRYALAATRQIVATLRRHCSDILGEPTGRLSPLESLTAQMRAHARRGIAEDNTTPPPKLEPEALATARNAVDCATAILDDLLAAEPIEGTNPFNERGLASEALEILHYARLLSVLPPAGVAERAFRLMQLVADGGAAQGLAEATRSAVEPTQRRTLLEEYRLALLERAAMSRKLLDASLTTRSAQEVAQPGTMDALDRRIAELQAALTAAGFASDNAAVALAPEAVQAALSVNEAALAFHVGERAVFIVAISSGQATLVRVEIEGEFVRVICEGIVESATLTQGEAAPDFDVVNALLLHDLLFRPLASLLGPRTHLLILCDGPLWTVPFACLITGPPQDSQADGPMADARVADSESDESTIRRARLSAMVELADGTPRADLLLEITRSKLWLADRFAISLMPGFAPLASRHIQASSPPGRKPFLGFGDPALDGQSDTLGAVPETRRLLIALAEALGADPLRDVITGRAATVDRMVELSEAGELARRRVLCFATHAVYPAGDSDLLNETGLLFADAELLTALDVSGLRLDADFVALTACFTGSPSGRSITNPLSGLAQAFLTAGARSLLVSHWAVDASPTELFTRALAEAMRDGETLSQALRSACGRVRKSGDNPSLSHPAFWAGFSIIGDGGRPVVS
jgi:CHAT domain-containing protein